MRQCSEASVRWVLSTKPYIGCLATYLRNLSIMKSHVLISFTRFQVWIGCSTGHIRCLNLYNLFVCPWHAALATWGSESCCLPMLSHQYPGVFTLGQCRMHMHATLTLSPACFYMREKSDTVEMTAPHVLIHITAVSTHQHHTTPTADSPLKRIARHITSMAQEYTAPKPHLDPARQLAHACKRHPGHTPSFVSLVQNIR